MKYTPIIDNPKLTKDRRTELRPYDSVYDAAIARRVYIEDNFGKKSILYVRKKGER